MGIKNSALGIAIIIMTMFVVVYGIHTFYPSPEYSEFCPNFYEAESMIECENLGGEWRSVEIQGDVKSAFDGRCENSPACYKEYNLENEKYSRNLFFITLPLGILIIAGGAYFFSLSAVGAGLMGGGIGTLLYGVSRYWSYGEDWLKFILSLIGLGLLIWFSYWLNNKNSRKK